MANKMADKKKNASQRAAAESKVQGSEKEKEQSKNAKAVAREREERKEREIRESKPVKRESKQPSAFQTRFRNNRIVRFVREAYHELRYKVTWPTFQEARNMTLVVIAISVAIAILLGIADAALFYLFKLISGKY